MKRIEDIDLMPIHYQALVELRRKLLLDEHSIDSLVLYGSVARGQSDDESDMDVLVLTTHPFTRWERHRITDVVFDINLQYGTNLSTLVVDRTSWETGLISVLPIHEEILKDGVML